MGNLGRLQQDLLLMALSEPRKVAIVGGGLTGIASFWALQDSCHDVHLFEASPELGGHMKTLLFESSGNKVKVDMELPTFNPKACPNLFSLLYYLGISTTAVKFPFGVLDDTSSFGWHISIMRSILSCPQILCKLETYRLLLDAISWRYFGADVLANEYLASEPADGQDSTDRYLSEKGYSDSFRDRYLAPLLSMLWRTNAGRFLPRLPVKALARSLSDHQLISTCKTLPKWRRIEHGVSFLIGKMTRHFPRENVHLQTRVIGMIRHSKSQYGLVTSDGKQSLFDHVILTVDEHEILRLLGSTATADERDILGGLGITKNIAVLHSDYHLNTGSPLLGYNYIMATHSQRWPDFAPPKSCMRYNVNELQDIPDSLSDRKVITLNPLSPPHPTLVHGVWEFTEPEPSADSLHAQSHLPSIQNKRGLSYGYCWTGRGLIEDAITSGLRIAVEDLGASVPFQVVFHPQPLDSSEFHSRHLGLRDNLIRTALQVLRVMVLGLEIILILLGRIHSPGSKVRARLNVSRAIKS